jgi:hypothetical protein
VEREWIEGKSPANQCRLGCRATLSHLVVKRWDTQCAMSQPPGLMCKT